MRFFNLLLVLLLAVVVGCNGSSNSEKSNKKGSDSNKKEDTPKKGDETPKDDDKQTNTDTDKGTIGISVQNLTNPFFKLIADTVEAEAAKIGYRTIKLDAQQDVAKQKDQVKDMLVKEVDAIILCPCDTKAIGPAVIEANEKGTPVFTIDTICEDPNAKIVSHVGTDNVQGGEVAGQAMIDYLGEAGGQIAILEYKAVESCLDRIKGFKKKVDEHNATAANKIEIVGYYDCEGAIEKGQNAARDALNSHPEIRGIFSINDPAALGAIRALEAVNKTDQVVVVGFDGQPDAKQAVKDGLLFDTPTQFPDRMATQTVANIAKYFDGDEVEAKTLFPTAAYRKADADKDDSLKGESDE